MKPSLVVVVAALFVSLAPCARADILVASNSVWKYLDNGSDQGTAWQAPGFDDSAWASGPAELGYGDGPERPEATTNSFGPDPLNKYITTYYRHAFWVTGAASFTNLVVSLLRDDGAVVYLNGTEVFRDNLPEGSILYTTTAPVPCSDDGTIFYPNNADPAFLREGLNVLAVEIHQCTNTSTDISFDLELSGSRSGAAVPPTVAVTSPADNVSFTVPVTVGLEATASDADGTVSKVEFYQGATKLGEDTTNPFGYTWSSSQSGSYTFTAVATDSSGLSATSAPVTVNLTGSTLSSGGLAFDGYDDYVTFGVASGLGVSNFTIEAWFNWSGGGSTASSGAGGITAIPLVTKGCGEADGNVQDANYFLGIRWPEGVLGADFEAIGVSPNNFPVWGNTAVTPNVWHHAAVTYNGATWQLFLDGILETNLTLAAPQLPRWDSIQHAGLGSALNSMGTPSGYFAGVLDEVRIWNYARTPSQIAANSTVQIASAPGLLGRWALDETSGATAFDSAGNDINGTLVNGPLWTNGYVFSMPPSVAITNPAEGALFTTPVNITISAQASDPDGTVAKVEFLQGATKLGEDTSAPFGYTWNNPAPGRYTLRAVATDNSGVISTSAPVNITVENSIVQLTNPTNGARFVAPENISLAANASDSGGTIARVEFFQAVTKLGEDTTRPFSLVWSNVTAGTYALTAVAVSTGGIRNTSAPVNITVAANLPPAVAITYPSGGASFYSPTNVAITATASDSDGSVARVAFYDGSTKIGEDTSSPYVFTWTNPPVAAHALSAVATDDRGLSTTSAVVNISVILNTAPTVQSVSPPAGTVNSLASIQVTFSEPVTGVDAADFLVNGVPATKLSGGGAVYTFSFDQPGPGTVAITWAVSHGIVDQGIPTLAFNRTGAGATWNYLLVDNTPPTIVAQDPPAYTSVTNLTQIQVTFSEPVTGVDAADLLINGSPAIGLSGSGAAYTFAFAQPLFGAVNITWAGGHGIADLSSNPFDGNGAGATWQYTLEAPRLTLVPTNAVYGLFKGVTEASSPVDAWRAPGFDDSSWSLNPAPFYYDLDGRPEPYYGNTPLPDMQAQYLTIYLRHAFTVNNPQVFTNLVLKSKTDDGFIAWLNGAEIYRAPTVPAGEVPYTYPDSYVMNNPEPLSFVTHVIPVPASVLVAGTNVLAVQAMNTTRSSSDFLIDVELYVTVLDPSLSPPTIAAVNPPAGDVFSLNSITVTFSEPVTGVNAADLRINGVPASGMNGDSNVWTFSFAQPAYGTVSVTWAASHGITDLDSPPKPFNATAPGATFQYSLLNPNAPTVASQTPLGGSTINQLTQMQVSFSENVTGVDATDLLVNGAPATGVSGSGATRTFTFPQPAYGPVTISWAASHGITDLEAPPNPFDRSRPSSTWQYTLVDQTPPAILSQTPPANASVTNLTQLQVTFSEPVTGVGTSDLLINGVPATGLSGSGANYTFTFAQPNATVVNLTWVPNHGIKDLATVPNAFDATAPGATWVYYTPDNVPPTAAGITPPPGATIRSLTLITVLFTETVTGVDANDLLINGSPAQSVVGSGAGPYSFQFASPATGEVTVAWAPAHGIRDLAMPPNAFAGPAWGYTFNPNARFDGAIVINEIMYHPMSENTNEEYLELRNVSSDMINLSGWRFSRGVDFTFPNVSIPAGGYLVVAANLAAFTAKYPGVANVVGGWVGRLSNIDEDIELEDATGVSVNRVHYADEGDWAIRQRGPLDNGARGWEWYSEHDGSAVNTATGQTVGGKSLELINAAMPNDNGENWAASGPVNGTPGAANSVASTNIAPLISDVIHFPAVPKPTDMVTISARIQDEQAGGIIARVFYRNHSTTSPPGFTSTDMFDDGLHNDGAAGDGVYAVVLSASPNGAVIEFYVQAVDAQSNTRTWPAAARQLDGSFAQTANALYQVDENLAPPSPVNAAQPMYRLVMTESERVEFANINRNSDAEMNATFITSDADGIKVRYNCGLRIRGAGTRGRAVTNFRVNVPTDRRWNGVNELNLNTQFIHSQAVGSALAARAALPAAETRVVQVRVNGANLASSLTAPANWAQNGQGDGFGSYLYLEALNADWSQRLLPNNAGGNFYRASIYPWIANLRFLNTTNGTTWMQNGYSKTSNQSENDWSDLNELTRALSSGLAESDYLEAVRTNVNVEMFMRYFVVCNLIDYMETSLCRGIGDDYAMYRGTPDRRFIIVPHDFDTILGQGDTGGSTTRSIWSMIDNPASTDPAQQATFLIRLMRHPQFAPVYFREIKQALDTTFSDSQFNSLLDQVLGGWVPDQIITDMKSFMANRRASVLAQLPLRFAVNTYPAQTTTSTVTISGTANAIDTATVRVNGAVSAYSVWQGRWTNTVTLQPGINNLFVQCLDTNNAAITSTNLTVWYDDGNVATFSGTLGGDTVWSAAGGPYSVPSTLTVPQGVRLTIQAGASVYLGAGANLVVNGQLLAEGTEYQHIRFTRPPASTASWGNLQINDSPGSPETRIAYADFQYNVTNIDIPCLQVTDGTVLFDHLTFGNTAAPYIHVDGSSFVIRDCVFPATTDSFEPIHGSRGIKTGGRGIFLRNFFGPITGYNDTIDFTGGQRPGPIVQFINNVFMGSGDDNLDLDNTDAWVEGNIFMHVHKNGSPDTSSGVSGGNDTGQPSDVTIINNIFFDCDQAAMAKQDNFFTLINNTIVHQTHQGGQDTDGAVICLEDNSMTEGDGMYLEGNVIWDVEKLTRNLTSALVTFTNNLMPLVWSGPGGGNLNADPLFNHIPQLSETTNFTTWAQAQVMKDWLSLRAGSPAVGTGPNGRDKGGVVPFGVSISGEPVSPTSQNSATLRIGINRTGSGIPTTGWPNGSGYTHYRWRLDGGAWSAETPLATPIALSGLVNGQHYVEVVGRRDSGLYQDDPVLGQDALITTSRTWTISPNAPALLLNEVLASNDGVVDHNGTTPDCLELFNPTAVTQSLAGLRITDDPQTPGKFVFPPGATLAPRSYLVVYANNLDGTPGYHLGFNFNQQGESIYLFDSLARGGALLDTVSFGPQLTDLAIGRLADGQWALTTPTFGAANLAAPVGDPHALRINEWLASGQVTVVSDFVELFNPNPLPVSLGGLFLTDNPVGWPDRHQIVALSFMPAYGYFAFKADGQVENGPEHLNFQLSSEQGMIGLFDDALNVIDLIYYEPQHTDVSQGRSPNGGSQIVLFNQPTPGAPNPLGGNGTNITTITLNLLDLTSTVWKYDQLNDLTGINWFATDYDDSAWAEGRALLAFENNASITPLINTALADPRTAAPGLTVPRVYYFRTTFNLTTNLEGFTLTASARIDDGAVIYVNGVEVPQRVRMNTGTTVVYTDLATSTPGGGDATSSDYLNIPLSMLQPGVNVVAAEVHQNAASSSDIVWGMALDATRTFTNIVGSSPVVINEVLANNSSIRETDGSAPDWIELYNQSGDPVNLSDYSLTDDLANRRRWVFPAGTTIQPLNYLRIRCDGDQPASTNSGGVLNTGFGLKATGSGIYLFDPWPTNPALSQVNFGLQATDFSVGRVPDGVGEWMLCAPTPDSANIAAGLGNVMNVKVNEWMAGPSSGDDWFELYNPNPQPVAVGGLYLSDDLAIANRLKSLIPPLSFLGVGTNAYQKFVADSNLGAGADHVDFGLKVGGEAVGLSTPAAVLIDGYAFGVQQTGVSEGRFPDGGATILRFPGTDSPGESNYRLLTNVVINEALTHTDPPLEDAIELHNVTGLPVNIGGWWLSDAKGTLQKYRIPDNTTIQPHSFRVIYEAQFNRDTNDPACFALSSEGDDIYLSAANSNGLTGYRASAHFGASENGVSFGRYVNSVGQEQFVAMSARTFGKDDPASVEEFRTGNGATNAYPRVGPIVISEIMYHPPDQGTNDNVLEEFIELTNITTTSVPLYDPAHPTNTWRLRNAVDLDFPPGLSIPPGGYLLVVSFNPQVDPGALAAFRAKYNLDPSVAIVGPYDGKLANSTETIELKKPDLPNLDKVPYVLVEEVTYSDSVPWPPAADGLGYSLQRISVTEFGNDPANWMAATPTPGPQALLDSDSDGMPNIWESAYGLDPYNAADALQDPDGDGMTNLQEYRAGTDPRDGQSALRLEIVLTDLGAQLQFTAMADQSYTIEYCDDLASGTWTPLWNFPAQTSTRVVQVTATVTANNVRFYRVRTPQSP